MGLCGLGVESGVLLLWYRQLGGRLGHSTAAWGVLRELVGRTKRCNAVDVSGSVCLWGRTECICAGGQ
eukprot:scaffold24324_cov28-Tisochrysis_lutea.AAC.1